MMSAMTFFDAALVQSLIEHYGYAAVFAVVMLESSGLPLPGETVLVCAGIYAGTQHGLDIRLIIAAAACGAILGDNFGFWAGRRFGRSLLLKYGHFIKIDSRQLAIGEYIFGRYGGIIVFCGRFVAFLRVYAAILAGANRLRPLDFVIYNATGGLAWATVFGLGAYLVGKNIQHFLGPIGWVALASFAVGGLFLWSFYKSHEGRLLADAERALSARKRMHRDI
jgi:membrane protein DedA with SNARE-associated domain